MISVESGLKFEFATPAIKYDDCEYYKELKKSIKSCKAVDFLVLTNKDRLVLMEVKNFVGHEGDTSNRERLSPKGDDPLHMEIACKVKDTLAGLIGASTCPDRRNAKELETFYKKLQRISSRIIVIAFIEGKLSNYKGHGTGEKGLEIKVKKALQWLNCEVVVMNTKTKIPVNLFTVSE